MYVSAENQANTGISRAHGKFIAVDRECPGAVSFGEVTTCKSRQIMERP